MSRSVGNCIADSLEQSLRYAERLLNGVTPETFARFARPGGVPVESNHAAFVYGHLSLYPARIVAQLGQASAVVPSPATFEPVFSRDAKCVDDPDGAIYPAMAQITETFFSGYRAAARVLRETKDDAFQGTNPAGGRLTELFPTIGSMHAFYVGGHVMMHLGQVSAWRRMWGLPPA